MSNNLSESAGASRQNNTRELDVTVPVPLVTRWLDRKSAKEAGGDFTVSGDGPSACYYYLNSDDSYERERLMVKVSCIVNPFGGKADFEAYKGFTLKNGWKVKSFEVSDSIKGYAGWRWVTTPANGSANPYGKLHLWAQSNAESIVFLKVKIEGPDGTNPYQ